MRGLAKYPFRRSNVVLLVLIWAALSGRVALCQTISVSIGPTDSSLRENLSSPFTEIVTNTTNKAVACSINPSVEQSRRSEFIQILSLSPRHK